MDEQKRNPNKRYNNFGQEYEPAKPCNGRPTRRHQDCQAHFDAHEKWEDKKSPEAKREHAQMLREERNARSTAEQLALLDRRLGKGVGAKKERARLQAQIDSQK